MTMKTDTLPRIDQIAKFLRLAAKHIKEEGSEGDHWQFEEAWQETARALDELELMCAELEKRCPRPIML